MVLTVLMGFQSEGQETKYSLHFIEKKRGDKVKYHLSLITYHCFLINRLNGVKTDAQVKLNGGVVVGGDMQGDFADAVLLEPEQGFANKGLAKPLVPETR